MLQCSGLTDFEDAQETEPRQGKRAKLELSLDRWALELSSGR